ncbi:stage II sporulation protein E [Ancylomarina salipaludis]|uniref:Stage II sporulation protein E n=1 Tax=Ancylomarina salipaludis TaxID=2501299 RepID=A0A4V1N078_9BACT|nr:SpoIIE family protein phosphatase [Ancylomarina salipaludis]RXQ95612.1 stage II sporulation protein E [Ancylomarina salipaludis]
MEEKFHLDIDCPQLFHYGDMICGDVFLSRRIKEENRTIVILSDGMGSGVKANVLATLTASMAMNFTIEHKDFKTIAEIIMNTLPVCSVRKVSYSTFTIVDIEYDGTTRIMEFDNPDCVIMRGDKFFDPGWENIELESEENKGKILRACQFIARKEDRILFWSDGIMQSGMGSQAFPFGWGLDNVVDFVKQIIKSSPYISSNALGKKIVKRASRNDQDEPKDDTSAGVIYFREPRKLLLCTGPPFEMDKDSELAMRVYHFKGKKIICGGSTAEIIARELGLKFAPGMTISDPELPPIAYMESINLVTEGILTIGKVARILEEYDSNYQLGEGPADQIVHYLLQSDQISIINGTRINLAHQDPNLPVELEIRRTVVKRVVRLLEEKFLKDVKLNFI